MFESEDQNQLHMKIFNHSLIQSFIPFQEFPECPHSGSRKPPTHLPHLKIAKLIINFLAAWPRKTILALGTLISDFLRSCTLPFQLDTYSLSLVQQ